MGAKAQPKTGGRKAGTPNKIQSALNIIRAEVFAEAVRTGRTAPGHPRQFRRFNPLNARTGVVPFAALA